MTKTKSLPNEVKDKPNRFGFIALFVFCILLIGGFGYFFKKDALKHQSIQRQDHRALLSSLSQKDEEIKNLKNLILQLQNRTSQSETSSGASYSNLQKKVSIDLQKVIMQQKIERRLLNGKDYSIELHTLNTLLKGALNAPEFETLRRHAAEGIPTTYEIEKAIRRTPVKSANYSQKNSFLHLFSHFFTVSSRENKKNFEMLIELIRTDRMQNQSIKLMNIFQTKKIEVFA
ncbi:MAG: hypothetical protein H6925_01180 [Holosporaceae bacterium]|nr:MAG: hypothetical protein H6925_01180 [Holosporaceae bacterium]